MNSLAEFLAEPCAPLPDRWGPWRLNRANLTLAGPGGYEIDLEALDSSAAMLDWLFQIAGKPWGPDALPGLIAALRDLLDPQSNFCAGGIEQRADPRAVLRRRLEASR